MKVMNVTVCKTANIVSLVEKGNESHIIKTWYDKNFTKRKLNNKIKELAKNAPTGTYIAIV